MMNKSSRLMLVGILITGLLIGCATQYSPVPAFDAQPIAEGQFDKKVERLDFILDASSSMADGYQGHEKLEMARTVIENFNQTMPALDIDVALHSFGHHQAVSGTPTATLVQSGPYSRAALAQGVAKASKAGGYSPLARSLKNAAISLKAVTDPIAMVIVSDGREMASETLAAAQALADDHGNRLCIYTVQVGDAADGAALLGKIAKVTECGSAKSAADLSSGEAMAAFVEDVLLTRKSDSDGDGVADDKDRCPDTPRGVNVDMNGCPPDSDADGVYDYQDQCPNTPRGVKVDRVGCPLDSDKDGVADYMDQCPNTPADTQVDDRGCPLTTKSAELTAAGTWIYKDIQFENNSAALRTSSYPTLDEIAELLNTNASLKIEIQGHTDSSGAHDYNVNLSQRRAQSVKAYLEEKGIAPSRMTTRGFGPDLPIDTNSTQQGRARNRRVEIKPIE